MPRLRGARGVVHFQRKESGMNLVALTAHQAGAVTVIGCIFALAFAGAAAAGRVALCRAVPE